MRRLVLVLSMVCVLLAVGVQAQAQLCADESFYDARSWTWSYKGPCSTQYNCLAYALGITNQWVWPWGYSNPTSSQVESYLEGEDYGTTGSPAKIISYGSSSAVVHFGRVTGSTTTAAKWGSMNLLDHGSWSPYYSNPNSYGGLVDIYYETAMIVSISGPTWGDNSGTYEWCGSVSGYATPPYTYDWRYSYDGSSYTSYFGNTQCRTAQLPLDRDLYLKLTVTDSVGKQAVDYHVTFNSDAACAKSKAAQGSELLAGIQTGLDELAAKAQSSSPFAPALLSSSNPYAYTSLPAYQKIVAQGVSALPDIRAAIKLSDHNGLGEYLLAIAAGEIAGNDLKQNDGGWATAKEWERSWGSYLQAMPKTVDEIVHSGRSEQDRVAALVELGAPAIPFILDAVEAGAFELLPAVEQLIDRLGLGGRPAPDAIGPARKVAIDPETIKILRSLVTQKVIPPC